MSRKNTLIKGTLVLTVTGLITRFMGFFYRIFLSHSFGEEGVGLYQLIFPVYALGFSFTSAGIELALSRCISKHIALNNKDRAYQLLSASLILTLSLSCFFTLLLQNYSEYIALNILKNADATELLLILSYVFPFAAIHSCIVGFCFGLKQTKIPAYSQFLEQLFRIASVFILYKLSKLSGFSFTISFAVIGLIIGEIASSVFCIKSIRKTNCNWRFSNIKLRSLIQCSRELLYFSLPLTGSRVLLNILQSVEAVSIPLSLQAYGMTSVDALSIYGVLTGMALPCILFPSAITNAVSTMLLPTVSEIQALKDKSTLYKIIQKAVYSCTFLGVFCCIIFFITGNFIGNLLFDSLLAGKFIATLAFICPFMYTNNTLISIINGIGKTVTSLFINVFNLSIRIFSVLYMIPVYGIYGYLIGLLASQIIVFLCSILYLYKEIKAEVI